MDGWMALTLQLNKANMLYRHYMLQPCTCGTTSSIHSFTHARTHARTQQQTHTTHKPTHKHTHTNTPPHTHTHPHSTHTHTRILFVFHRSHMSLKAVEVHYDLCRE